MKSTFEYLVLRREHSYIFITISIIIIITIKINWKKEFASPRVPVYKIPISSESEKQFLESLGKTVYFIFVSVQI